MQIDREAVNKLLSLNDFQLRIVIKRLLIENGIDWLEFCIPDEHSHSTELAGYVGAHMIFRALFGECPIVSARPSLKYDETIEILRPYIRHGALQVIAEEDIFYLG